MRDLLGRPDSGARRSVFSSLFRRRRRASQKPSHRYRELLDLPRYQRSTVTLGEQPFVVPDGVSFYHNYQEIFVGEIYRFTSPRSRPTIIDCGANIGTSVVYFRSLYPDCRITAVEADPEIFAVLGSNLETQGVSDVTLLNRAVSHLDEPVRFHVEGADAGRIHPLSTSGRSVTVETVKLDDLIEGFLDGPVDFLKIDVEGAETEAICSAKRLDRVDNLFVEYHSFRDAPQNLHRLLAALTDQGFRYYVQTQYCPARPLVEVEDHMGMDLQLNIFARRRGSG
jgi:FkbM family methyltransferase